MIRDSKIVMAQAQEDDLVELLAVFEEARTWMLSRGVNTWRPVALWRTLIAEKIARRVVYLARRDAQIVGTLTLEWEAPELWGAPTTHAGYLAHVVTRRERAGSGIGAQMLGWAEAEARDKGKTALRLDCAAENWALCAYYERAGFARWSTVRLGDFQIALYEKQISERGCKDCYAI